MELKNDKRGLEFKLAFFALVSTSMVIMAIGVILDDWNDKYDSGLTYDLDTDYNKLDDVSTTAESQRGNISVKSSAQDVADFEGTSIRAAFGILNTIYAPFDAVFGNGGMLDSATERFGIPNYIRQGLVTMIFFAFTFALIAIFFSRRKT